MQFVNLTKNVVYTAMSGNLKPGGVSPDGGPRRRRLEEALSEVVGVCGGRLGIRLNSREAELLGKLMTLDEKGGGFSPASLPPEVRDDPTGEKREAQARLDAQRREIEGRVRANEEAERREAEINGETLDRKPVGPATLKGEKVDPSDIKSGFERIMEENARIASGEKPKTDIGEVLDPIGAHAKGAKGASTSADPSADATKSADAAEPVPQASDARNAMDRQAAEVAGKLSHFRPDKADKAKKSTKGKKAGK